MLMLPSGESSGMINPIIVMMLWAEHLDVRLRAGMGKPTFPINPQVVASAAHYWQDLAQRSHNVAPLTSPADAATQQHIIDTDLAIDYGDPHGDSLAREKMAQALSRWYDASIKTEDILFTTGGLGGLYCAFEYLRRRFLNGRILTPFPYYPYYDLGNHLYPVDVMGSPGYRLTAELLSDAITSAHKNESLEHEPIRAVILCYPNNPLGTVLRKHEWQAIANALEALPDVIIILDEAYAELDFTHDGTSLFSVAPQLRDRIVLMRSGTKGLSAAGERLAVLVCQNSAIMTGLLEVNSTISMHPARHLQMAFADAMLAFTAEDKQQLTYFYQPQINYALSRLRAMGAHMPDPAYQVEGSFYVMANLQALFGQPLSKAAQKIFSTPHDTITNDEELVYSLLFDDKIMVAPGSYFGLDPKLGYVRITCSLGERDLAEIFDKIERRVLDSKA